MSRAERPTSLGVIFLTVFIDLIGFSIIFPLFPAMLEYYFGLEGEDSLIGNTVETLRGFAGADGEKSEFYTQVLFGGFLGSLYSILQFVFAPIWGRLSDRIGRRPVLNFTIAGLAVSYALWIFSGTFALLILARLLGGVMSGNISVATAAIADTTDGRSRSKGMALIGIAFGLGFILGPLFGALLSKIDLTEHTSLPGINPFSAAAIAAFALSLINWVWVWRRFHETLPDGAREKANTTQRIANPLRLFSGMDAVGVTRTNLIYFVFLVAFAGMEFTLTFLAKERFQYEAADMGWIFGFVGVIIVLVQGGVVRRMAPRVGEKKLAVVGLVTIVPGLVLVGLANSEGLLYTGLALLAIGSALATPCLTALVSLYSPEDRQGEALGIFRSLGALSRALGPILGCLVYWKFSSQWPYLGAAILLLLPIAMAVGLPTPAAREEEAQGKESAS